MSEIFEKPVKIKQILTASPEKARAVEDPIRAMILDILSQGSGSIIEIADELKERGVDKALTTIRHHVDVLKKAELVELAKLEDAGGGVLKYYASNTRVLGYETPRDFDAKLETAISETSGKITRIIEELMKKHRNEVKEVAESLKACPYCSTQHFVEYTILQILQRSIADAAQKREFIELLKV